MSSDSERDFYRGLVELGDQTDPSVFLAQALKLAVDATGARIGYLAIGPRPLEDPLWSHAVGVEDQAALRRAVSSTIVDHAAGELVLTHDALGDHRFGDAPSVRENRIDQVLGMPFVGGVLYLQGRIRPVPFGDDDLRLAHAFVRHLAPLASQLRWRAR